MPFLWHIHHPIIQLQPIIFCNTKHKTKAWMTLDASPASIRAVPVGGRKKHAASWAWKPGHGASKGKAFNICKVIQHMGLSEILGIPSNNNKITIKWYVPMKCWGIQFSSNPCWFEVGKIKVDKGPGRLRVLCWPGRFPWRVTSCAALAQLNSMGWGCCALERLHESPWQVAKR